MLAVVAWELVLRHLRRAAIFVTAAIPALLWWTYSRIHLGAWFTSGDTALGRPLAGWRAAFNSSGFGSDKSAAAHAGAVVILVALVAVIVVGAIRALRLQSPLDYTYLGLAAVAVCLAPNATVALSTAFRNTAFLITLVPFVIVTPLFTRRSKNP